MKHNQPDPTIPPVMADAPLVQPIGDYVVPPHVARRESTGRQIIVLLIILSGLPGLCLPILYTISYMEDHNAVRTVLMMIAGTLPLWIPIVVWRRRRIIYQRRINSWLLLFLPVINIGSYIILALSLELIYIFTLK